MLRRWLAVLCLLAAGLAGAAAEEFRTPSIIGRPRRMAGGCRSAPHRDRHPPGDRFPIYVRRPAARAGMGSARDARAGATERRSTQACSPGSDAARCRCCCRSIPRATSKTRPTARAAAVALPGRFPSRRPVSRRPGRLRRGVFAAIQAQARSAGPSPSRSKCRSPARSSSTTSPIRSAARASRSRRWRRSSPTCAASSAKAMCATPSRASACPMWCRSSVSIRRRGRGGWPAARPIPLPSAF